MIPGNFVFGDVTRPILSDIQDEISKSKSMFLLSREAEFTDLCALKPELCTCELAKGPFIYKVMGGTGQFFLFQTFYS